MWGRARHAVPLLCGIRVKDFIMSHGRGRHPSRSDRRKVLSDEVRSHFTQRICVRI